MPAVSISNYGRNHTSFVLSATLSDHLLGQPHTKAFHDMIITCCHRMLDKRRNPLMPKSKEGYEEGEKDKLFHSGRSAGIPTIDEAIFYEIPACIHK
jgi:hypothetical protein